MFRRVVIGSNMRVSCPSFFGSILTLSFLSMTSVGFGAVTVEIRGTAGTEVRIQRFRTETLPILERFLDDAGLAVRLPDKLTIIFNEVSKNGERENLRLVYGDDFESRAKGFLATLESGILDGASRIEWESFLREIECAFPALGTHAISGVWKYASQISRPKVRDWLISQMKNILDPAVPPPSISRVIFKNTAATTVATPGSRCGVVVLGHYLGNGPIERSSDAHIDTVLHEAGHWIDAVTESTMERSLNPLQGLREGLADTIAQVYLNDPCHIRLETPFEGECVRRMDTPMSVVGLSGRPEANNSYQISQSVRYWAWTRIRGRKLSAVLPGLLKARDKANLAANEFDPEILLQEKVPSSFAREMLKREVPSHEKFIKSLRAEFPRVFDDDSLLVDVKECGAFTSSEICTAMRGKDWTKTEREILDGAINELKVRYPAFFERILTSGFEGIYRAALSAQKINDEPVTSNIGFASYRARWKAVFIYDGLFALLEDNRTQVAQVLFHELVHAWDHASDRPSESALWLNAIGMRRVPDSFRFEVPELVGQVDLEALRLERKGALAVLNWTKVKELDDSLVPFGFPSIYSTTNPGESLAEFVSAYAFSEQFRKTIQSRPKEILENILR